LNSHHLPPTTCDLHAPPSIIPATPTISADCSHTPQTRSFAAAFSMRIARHRQTLAAADTMRPHRGPAVGSTSFWGVYANSFGNYAAGITVAGVRI
jgi:hypothetical protein